MDDLESYINRNSTTMELPVNHSRSSQYRSSESSMRLQEDYELPKEKEKKKRKKKKKKKTEKRIMDKKSKWTGESSGAHGLIIVDEDDDNAESSSSTSTAAAAWPPAHRRIRESEEYMIGKEQMREIESDLEEAEGEEDGPVVVDMDEDVKRDLHRGRKTLRMDGDEMRIVDGNGNKRKESSRRRPTATTLKMRTEQRVRRQRHDSDESDSDLSPPRAAMRKRRRHDNDTSDSDLSPPRNARGHRSPPRRGKRLRHDSDDNDSDLSPPRQNVRRSLFPPPPPPTSASPPDDLTEEYAETVVNRRVVAGLKTAKHLRLEMEQKQQDTQQSFERMHPELSGRNADTVFRDARTGRRVTNEAEYTMSREKERKRRAKERERASRRSNRDESDSSDSESAEDETEKEETVIRKQSDMEWGSGLVQRQQSMSFRDQILKEMQQPFARHEDDTELEEQRKQELREGDPMAAYIMREQEKEKRKKVMVGSGILGAEGAALGRVEPKRRVYVGDAAPNRYGIRPGWRWDGRDRSNGYEERLLKRLNQNVASAQEAYKYDVGDW